MSEFHFAAARITTAKICRAAGLESCVPSVLDALTDILIRYLMMLGCKAREAAESSGDSLVSADDAMLAAVECDAVHGGLLSTGLRNGRVADYTGVEDIMEMMNWLNGPLNARLTIMARPQRHNPASIGAAQGAALAALPSSAATAAASQSQSSKSGPAQVEVPLNAAQASDPESSSIPNGIQEPPRTGHQPQDSVPEDSHTDWLKTALNRHALMGHSNMFVNTELGPHKDPDPTLYG